MSSFTDPLIVTKLPNGKWKTHSKFRYYIGEENSEDSIEVPRGFETDFASVPRVFWAIIPPDGKYSQAAVLHDYLYHSKIRSRKASDEIFLEAMEVLGVSWWRRKVMYYAVWSFGWLPWDNSD